MLRKHNADRRHHTLMVSFGVRNWLEYEGGLWSERVEMRVRGWIVHSSNPGPCS
jgi:hypothetical protein